MLIPFPFKGKWTGKLNFVRIRSAFWRSLRLLGKLELGTVVSELSFRWHRVADRFVALLHG